MIRDRQALASRIAYAFRDERLLCEALTHRSASGANNERLEFLGDAVLGAVVAARLFAAAGDASEGELSRLRASLVNKNALATIATEIALGDYLEMGSGELKTGGFRRSSILADALEALIGAVFLDGGQAPVEALIDRLFAEPIAVAVAAGAHKDAKTQLQETLQQQGLPLPDYAVTAVDGPSHQQTFTVQCSVADREQVAQGTGGSRRRAEQRAARTMLEILDSE